MLAQRAYAALFIPAQMQRDLEAGLRPEIVIFSNSQFLTAGGIASRSMSTTVGTFSAGVSLSLLQAQGIGTDQAMDLLTPIPVQQSPLFNPSMDYIQFLLSAVMPTVMQIFICATAVLSFSREHHSPNGMPRLLRLSGSPMRAIMGKLLPYTFVGTFVLLLCRYYSVSISGDGFPRQRLCFYVQWIYLYPDLSGPGRVDRADFQRHDGCLGSDGADCRPIIRLCWG